MNYMTELKESIWNAVHTGNIKSLEELSTNEVFSWANDMYLKSKMLEEVLLYDDVNMLKYLLSKDVDITMRDGLERGGYLGHAVSYESIGAVKYLLSNIKEIPMETKEEAIGRISIDSTKIKRSIEILEELINHGVDIKENQNRLWLNLVIFDNLEMIQHLVINHQCDINIPLKHVTVSDENRIYVWCRKYIGSKKLNENLELELVSKNDKIIKRQKI